ncbi:enoyl-CoA hydratase/isomerase family protein [Marinobacterium arenosum]|uniref:enoyl-CoA hydratase/isomerase family protein n=1 Tax=Marinobacterium arenosum TaxID=2862496 RepID=UPI001C953DE2|nr:enoyl-CoA hydratase/isomerase family protein [Marinobacterium arenosum]MBY4675051.1 enoyl-CoA hydratase/isomerase family protein [Marinobacterium arenosum]
MSCVLFNEFPTRDGKKVVEVSLNAERTLNALTLEMIDLIQPKLDAWKDDDSVVAVILDSAGEKAFCAGGDVVNLYKSMVGEGDANFPEDFFTREYILDHCIHTYPKPIICWGSGIVMGGGMGLMNGCSHRVVTESSHLAMPEVTIGLYPDVGGSWFLNHMPGNTGLFLGLTGNPMNAADALYLGLADRFVMKELRPTMVEQLQAEDWSGSATAAVNRVLRALERESQSQLAELESQVQKHAELIRRVTDQDTLAELYDALMAEDSEDKWVRRAQKALSHGSPLAVHIIARQMEVTRHMSLKEMFESELVLSVQCSKHREFPEGVRALLVDKDGSPDWTFKSIGEVDPAVLDEFFQSPWDRNPLSGKLQ